MKKIIFIIVLLSLHFTVISGETVTRHWNQGRGYAPFQSATENGLFLENTKWMDISDSYMLDTPINNLDLTFRAANFHSNPHKRYPYITANRHQKHISNTLWGFFLTTSSGDSLVFTVGREEKKETVESYHSAFISSKRTGVNQKGGEKIFVKNLDPYNGFNQWNIKFDKGIITITAGNKTSEKVCMLENSDDITGFGFFAGPAAALQLTDISLKIKDPVESLLITVTDPFLFQEYLDNSDDPMEGIWVVFDRELDESLIRQGGDYTLAIIKDGKSYRIIYLDGARINASEWKPGMRKGTLFPSPFPGIYKLEWIDSENKSLSYDLKAQIGEGEILNIQFPYQQSSIRLRKISRDSASQSNVN